MVFASALLGAVGTMRASSVCTAGPVDLAASTVISCGGLTFSDFGVVSAAPGTNATVTFVGATSVKGNVAINFNPGLSGSSGPKDLWLYYAISGAPVDSVQLTIGGTGASVDEVVSGAPIARNGPEANVCSGSTLANLAEFSPPAQACSTETSAPMDSLHVFRDVGVARAGELSNLSQVYRVPGESQVPEPVTAGLIGAGLVVVGWLGRRRVRK